MTTKRFLLDLLDREYHLMRARYEDRLIQADAHECIRIKGFITKDSSVYEKARLLVEKGPDEP